MSKLGVNEAAQYFEGIFTTAHEGIVLVDHEGIILRINPALTKILGYEENEILGKPFYILNFKDQVMKKGSSHSPLYRFYSSEKTSMEYGFFDKQGRDVTIHFRSFIIRDEHGQAKGAVGMLEHMVELTGTDEAGSSLAEKMWEAQQNFDNVLENSADAVLICDNRGNITMANKAFLKMLNYTQEEVIGKFIVEFTAVVEGTYATTTGEEIIIDEESVNNTGSRSAELFEKGYIKNWETYCVRKDKVHVPVDATLSVMKDKGGERRGSIVVLRDITERRSAEIENKKSRDFLENIFRTTADGIIVTDNNGIIIMFNEALEKILGYSKEELIGKSTSVLKPEGMKHNNIADEYLTKLFEEGVVTAYELTWLKKDGRLMDAEVNSSLLKDDKGNVTGSVSSIREITERKQAEKKIKETKDHLDNIIESSLDGIIVGDSTGNIVRVNKSFLALIGYQIEEVLGKHIMELSITEPGTYESTTGEMVEINEDYFNDTREIIYEKLIAKGTLINWESYYLNKNGRIVPVEQNIAYLYNEEGDVIGSVGINRDITERKIAEKEIKEAKEFLENIFKTTTDGIIITDNEGSITIVNEAVARMVGYSQNELIGKSTSVLNKGEIYKKDSNAFVTKLFEEGAVTAYELTWLKKDGVVINVEVTSALLKDSNGNNTGTVTSIRDITDRKKMELQLLQSEKLKSLGELAGGVAHDFNNVLAAILGRAQLLKMNIEPPPGKEEKRKSVLALKKGLEVIERASLDGAETVRRIQEFAR
ncbi:MAG: PAS domain S-box protein, partial [Deltaproteobacteria bacterium]|nr:PAS domain S-box protein [Deltaproteobacteria bacterium]